MLERLSVHASMCLYIIVCLCSKVVFQSNLYGSFISMRARFLSKTSQMAYAWLEYGSWIGQNWDSLNIYVCLCLKNALDWIAFQSNLFSSYISIITLFLSNHPCSVSCENHPDSLMNHCIISLEIVEIAIKQLVYAS